MFLYKSCFFFTFLLNKSQDILLQVYLWNMKSFKFSNKSFYEFFTLKKCSVCRLRFMINFSSFILYFIFRSYGRFVLVKYRNKIKFIWRIYAYFFVPMLNVRTCEIKRCGIKCIKLIIVWKISNLFIIIPFQVGKGYRLSGIFSDLN